MLQNTTNTLRIMVQVPAVAKQCWNSLLCSPHKSIYLDLDLILDPDPDPHQDVGSIQIYGSTVSCLHSNHLVALLDMVWSTVQPPPSPAYLGTQLSYASTSCHPHPLTLVPSSAMQAQAAPLTRLPWYPAQLCKHKLPPSPAYLGTQLSYASTSCLPHPLTLVPSSAMQAQAASLTA